MLRLRDFRQNVKGLSDLLSYAALIDEGIILQKDGSFLAAYEFIGQDTASMTDEQLEFLVSQANVAVNQLAPCRLSPPLCIPSGTVLFCF